MAAGNESGNDPTSLLQPVLKEIMYENFRKQCLIQMAPEFWTMFRDDMSPGEILQSLISGLEQLQQFVMTSMSTVSLTKCLPTADPESHVADRFYKMVRCSLCVNIPLFFPLLVEKVFTESLYVWEEIFQFQHGATNDESLAVDSSLKYLEEFKKMIMLLQSLHLLECLCDFPIITVIERKIHHQITKQCSGIYDERLLEDVVPHLTDSLLLWLQQIYGKYENTSENLKCQILNSSFKEFANLSSALKTRWFLEIGELFEIIVDFPDSKPALMDLKLCLQIADVEDGLISCLKESFQRRLLHSGVNTADIITQYISAIKALRLLDSSGVLLEKVCGPVRAYLYSRTDTVKCIVASLTNDGESDLAEIVERWASYCKQLFSFSMEKVELITGNISNNGPYQNGDKDNKAFVSWIPDPVGADPNTSSATRQYSDIISLLVNIYGSYEMFVAEYRNLLADRLLQSFNFDVSREVCTLERLKLRFGENCLHFCEVMLKDVADSRRINKTIFSPISNKDEGLQLQGYIISEEFWPTINEQKFELPSFVQKKLNMYTLHYQNLKGMRKLVWKANLGSVDVMINIDNKFELSLRISPICAAIIYHFQKKNCWKLDDLSMLLDTQSSIIRKHVTFWIAQGIIKEVCKDTFAVVYQKNEFHKEDMEYYEETEVHGTLNHQAEFQVYWNYIKHMLTNLGSISFERVHTMLNMFGNMKEKIEPYELKQFLEKKVFEQQLFYSNGEYHLVQ